MRVCISKGCDNQTRPKQHNDGSDRWYFESRCNVCANLMKKYKITGPERDEMLEKQNHCCPICEHAIEPAAWRGGQTSRTAAVVDHCHETNQVRGVLCGKCNVGLGHFKDSQQLLIKAIAYLKEYD